MRSGWVERLGRLLPEEIARDLLQPALADLLRQELGAGAKGYYVEQLLAKLDVMGNFAQWWARGLVDTSQIWFYAGGTMFFLFLTVLSFSARRVA